MNSIINENGLTKTQCPCKEDVLIRYLKKCVGGSVRFAGLIWQGIKWPFLGLPLELANKWPSLGLPVDGENDNSISNDHFFNNSKEMVIAFRLNEAKAASEKHLQEAYTIISEATSDKEQSI